MPADLPLSVWPTAQQNARAQRAGRYVDISGTHPAKMLPAIAARAIATYSAPGDLVLDPMAGIGSTLVEAVHLGRDAIGVEYEPPWAELARANLRHATSQGATGHGEVVCGDARHLPAVVDPAAVGLVALVVTSPPYGASLHGRVTARPGQGIAKSHNRYSTDPANLAHVGLGGLLDSSPTRAMAPGRTLPSSQGCATTGSCPAARSSPSNRSARPEPKASPARSSPTRTSSSSAPRRSPPVPLAPSSASRSA
jgi:hypothetical protein